MLGPGGWRAGDWGRAARGGRREGRPRAFCAPSGSKAQAHLHPCPTTPPTPPARRCARTSGRCCRSRWTAEKRSSCCLPSRPPPSRAASSTRWPPATGASRARRAFARGSARFGQPAAARLRIARATPWHCCRSQTPFDAAPRPALSLSLGRLSRAHHAPPAAPSKLSTAVPRPCTCAAPRPSYPLSPPLSRQVLNRLTYASTISHLRRVNSPIGREGKLAKPRQLHNSLCAAAVSPAVALQLAAAAAPPAPAPALRAPPQQQRHTARQAAAPCLSACAGHRPGLAQLQRQAHMQPPLSREAAAADGAAGGA
jgi:hypothetical protein